jgi:hypothetical protein
VNACAGTRATVLTIACLATASATAGTNLLNDPGFDIGEPAWGKFGAADFNDFFGGNPHASLFADNNGNSGGVFQAGIANTEGALYEFTLTDVRIESNFNANFHFGLEFYDATDSTKLGETIFNIDTNDPSDGLITGDGLGFSMQATGLTGATFARPIITFDGAAPLGSGQANAFVFDASLIIVPAPGATLAMLAAAPITRRRR